LEQNHLTRRATVVQDRAIATSQPLDNGGFEIVVRVRPITEPTVPAGTTNPSIDVIASARSLVLPTSFQEPNAAPRANRNATPDRELRPIQPGQLTPTATRSPSDQLTELTEPGRLVINAESEQTTEFPIDLPTALRLAGANNLHIALAAERVEEALAKAQASRAKWLPSLNAGISYNKHDGQIQATEGTVLEANRGSLFVGGGVGLGGSPLNGGSGGPPRLFVDMSLAELLFEPLAARQMVDAAAASQSAVFNEKVLQAAIAYQRLVYSQAMIAIREEAVEHATRLVEITSDFAEAGEGYPADAHRARADLGRREGELLEAEEAVGDASTALALVLRLDPSTRLVTTDTDVVPVDLFNQGKPLESLIAQAIAARPDLESAEILVNASSTRAELEHWRPWLPHLYVGYSAGGFGGNENSDLKGFGGRGDFDVAAVWQLENFGFGNAARRRSIESQHRQAHLEVERLRDKIAAEVTTAFHRSNSRRLQIDAASPRITAANTSLELNFISIRGGVLRPIEPQQAIGALVDARSSYLNALMRYNAAQLQLLYAIGLPPDLPNDGGSTAGSGSPQPESVPPPLAY
jgi:outer membrane protein TolC